MATPLSFPLRVAGTTFEDGPRAQIHDPFRGEVVGEVVLADAARAELAAHAAREAFEKTRRLAAFERKRLLRAITAGVERDAEAFAELMAREAGKPITLARGEVKRALSTLELGAEEAVRLGGEVIPLDVAETSAGYVGGYTRVPVGPIMALSPFNFPLNLVCHKLAPALAAGASIVLKPAPQAPLTALRLADVVREAGAPKDAFQVVPCDVPIAEALVKDPRFGALSFTGSARVGWHLKSIAGKKRVLLELGGNAAVLVHEDADLAWALGRTAAAAFAYAGQVCIKAQRVYVHAPVYDSFVAELARRAEQMAPKDPLDPSTIVGPVIDEPSAARIELWVREAIAAGAKLLAGGTRQGTRLSPTVLAVDGSGKGLRVVDEEIFGPVVTVHRYATWEEGLALADGTRYGLQAAIFTRDVGRIHQAFATLDVGGLVVNDSPSFRVDAMPYGGTRDSGLGREGVRFAIEEITEHKLMVVRP